MPIISQSDSVELARQPLTVADSVPQAFVEIKKDIPIKNYFNFIDSLAKSYDTTSRTDLNEYVVVHANPWVLDSLRNSDYYILKEKGIFQYDQRQQVVLPKGNRLIIPDSASVVKINNKLKSTVLDVNIPEYKLRIIQSSDTILTCLVRVGRSEVKYLALVGHDVNLQTPIGAGEIIRIERNPLVINPDDGKPYLGTMRDDRRYTKMPITPWLEPSINGIRYGALIHATTNINTRGKAYSHGCVGTSESDAWTIYYNSPIGTKVIFRYDLLIKTEKGDTVKLNDIYHRGRTK